MAQVLSDSELDDFLSDLTTGLNSDSERLIKLSMTSRANKGTLVFVPIPEGPSGKFLKTLKGVKEVNQFTELNDKIEGDCWHKILPKEDYGELSEEDSLLYDQVSKFFDKLNSSKVWGEGLEKNYVARIRTYNLMYGYILSHTDENGKVVEGSAGRPALIIYPTDTFRKAFATAIDTKKLSTQGSMAWFSRYMSKSPIDRKGAVICKTSGGKGGYTITVSFESNSEDNPYLVPADLDLTKAFEKCQNLIGDFLGWQNGKETYFNRDLFLEMREYLTGYLLPDGSIDPKYLSDEGEAEGETPSADPLG